MSLLSVSGIYKKMQDTSLQQIDFTQEKLQKTAIAGATGSGKSTLLKIIAGLVQADAGEIHFEDIKVKGPEERLIPGQPGIAYLSQHFELRNHHRVEELLAYANDLTDEASEELYKVCRIDYLLKRRTDQLSGGEKQRVALAVLLTRSPRLLLLDEPFSNLDMIHRGVLKSVIDDLGTRLGTTCLLVSHDPQDVLPWADELHIMKDGHIIQSGSPEEIYRRPQELYTAGLMGRYNLLKPALARVFGFDVQPDNDKHVFIRPGDFTISRDANTAFAGKVTQVLFSGSYYELEVLLPGNALVIVTTTDRTITVGDSITVSLAQRNVWHI
ncbi:ABC transporter ATP-binding protein [Chitinophagaceae bacterium MMS25-I14]